jgi:hypothetical protein
MAVLLQSARAMNARWANPCEQRWVAFDSVKAIIIRIALIITSPSIVT